MINQFDCTTSGSQIRNKKLIIYQLIDELSQHQHVCVHSTIHMYLYTCTYILHMYVYTCTYTYLHVYIILCIYVLCTSPFAVSKGEVISVPNSRIMTGWGQWVWVSREGWLNQTKNGKPATLYCRLYILGYVIACVDHIPHDVHVLYVLE